MKDILVAIDFSKGSEHALQYAIELANTAQSNIIMIWVDNISIQEVTLAAETSEIREEAKKNLEEFVQKYKSQLKPGKISYKIRKGKVYLELSTQAKQCECGLLITGTHGVTGFEEYWIGSNAFRVVSYAPCPVISVKSNTDISRGIRRIVLPIIHTPQTIQKVQFTAKLARITGADINILGLNSSRLKTMQRVIENNVNKVERYLIDAGVNFVIDYVMTDNLTSAIVEHVQKVDADLIAVMTDGQNEPSTTVMGQFAQQLVNFAPVPVLSIHPRDNFTF